MRNLLLKLLLAFRGDEEPGPRKRRLGSWLLRNAPGMLSCEEFEAFVHDYYESLLSQKSRNQFETHMRLCPMCRVHFESYVSAVALGKGVCEEDDRLPADIPEELVGAVLIARSQDP